MQNSGINIPTVNNGSEQEKVHNINSSSSILNIQNLDTNNALLVNDFYKLFNFTLHRQNSFSLFNPTLKQNLLSAHKINLLLAAIIIIPILGIICGTLIQNYIRGHTIDTVDILCDLLVSGILNSSLVVTTYYIYQKLLNRNIHSLLNHEELNFRSEQEKNVLKEKV